MVSLGFVEFLLFLLLAEWGVPFNIRERRGDLITGLSIGLFFGLKGGGLEDTDDAELSLE
jgi:hypothetical protein